ncbi:MAG: BamA/TamA family outer membrane protein [Candidatus Thiothrix sulfatifontis]|nr:MAG: BamA/TamA family outer membrane protein [Candidatus Thiothrix sulfatifontis]
MAELRAAEAGVQVDVGRALNNSAEARAGIFFQRIEPEVKTGTLTLPGDSLTEAGLKLQYRADTLDSVNFPTKGGRMSATYTHGIKALGSDTDVSRIELEREQVWSKDKHRVIASGRLEANANNEEGLLYSTGEALQTGRLAFTDNDQLIGNYTLDGSLDVHARAGGSAADCQSARGRVSGGAAGLAGGGGCGLGRFARYGFGLFGRGNTCLACIYWGAQNSGLGSGSVF